MPGISLNHLPHSTHVPCSLVRCAVYFPELPVERTVPFDSTTEQPFFPYVHVLFHLAENSHRFFHTNEKRSRRGMVLFIEYIVIMKVVTSAETFLNPLTPYIKEQILLSCSHSLLIKVLWRSY